MCRAVRGRCDSARDRCRELSTNKCLYCSRATIYLPIRYPYSREPRGIKPDFRTCTHAHMTRRYNRTDHTEIDACGSYGGSCATSFLLWEGTRCVNGCRCWGSMSEAVIVPIGKVVNQKHLLCCCKVRERRHIPGFTLVRVAHRLTSSG